MLVEVFITEMSPPFLLATYILAFSASYDNARGPSADFNRASYRGVFACIYNYDMSFLKTKNF